MGQKPGKAAYAVEAAIFLNLPRKGLEILWSAFNDTANGFGLTEEIFVQIVAELHLLLGLSKPQLATKARELYVLYDTDQNGLIDSMEFLCSLAIASGIQVFEMIEFVLRCYDFDNSKSVGLDEVVLALKAALCGLSKLTNEPTLTEEQIEVLVSTTFQELKIETRLAIATLADFFLGNPDIRSWINFFAEPAISQSTLEPYKALPSEMDDVSQVVSRTAEETNFLEGFPRKTMVTPATEEPQPTTPWMRTVAKLTPSRYGNYVTSNYFPSGQLQLEWVYGYDGAISKNNAQYVKNGDIVYHSGKHAIAYTFASHTQRHFTGHNEQITCLATHPEGELIATGEAGVQPRVFIWSSQTLLVHQVLRGHLQRQISHVCFDWTGERIAMIGANGVSTAVCVLQWRSATLLFASNIDEYVPLDCCFNHGGTLAVCGDAAVNFWSKDSEGYSQRHGNFGPLVQEQALTCSTEHHRSHAAYIVTGTVTGLLLVWQDRNCIQHLKAHHGSVNVITTVPFGFITGGKDRRIRLWTTKLEAKATFDLSLYGSNPSIRSIDLSKDGSGILTGTRGGEIYEVSAVDGSDLRSGPITTSHFEGELQMLTVHPLREEFATVGDDRSLRIWDMETRSSVKAATFDTEIVAAGHNHNGELIAVAYGGETRKTGGFAVVQTTDLEIVHEARDSQLPPSLIQYSADGSQLALATRDGRVFIYSVSANYELVARCTLPAGSIATSLDFSVDTRFFRVSTTADTLCIFSCEDGSEQTKYVSLRDIPWASFTCTRAWGTQGIHQRPVTAVDVAGMEDDLDQTLPFLASGDSFGAIDLCRYPVLSTESCRHQYTAHVRAVASLRFAVRQARLISCGRYDRTILQWKCSVHQLSEAALPQEESKEAPVTESWSTYSELPHIDAGVGKMHGGEREHRLNPQEEPRLAWVNSAIPPTDPTPCQQTVCNAYLKLEHTYGVQCKFAHNALKYLASGNLVYASDAAVVSLNPNSRATNIHTFHASMVVALAVTNDGRLVASGDVGPHPKVIVWSPESSEVRMRLSGYFDGAILQLAFSPDGQHLAVLSSSSEGLQILHIFHWETRTLLSQRSGGRKRTYACAFNLNGTQLAQAGAQHVRFWQTFPSTRYMTMQDAAVPAEKTYTAIIFTQSYAVAASTQGELDVYRENKFVRSVTAQTCAIFALQYLPDRRELFSASDDGTITTWSDSLDRLHDIALGDVDKQIDPHIRSFAVRADGRRFAFATTGVELVEVNTKTKAILHDGPLVQGHHPKEIHGLATHPTANVFATVSDDHTLRFWDIELRSLIRSVKMDAPSRALAYSPDGRALALGFGAGRSGKKHTRHMRSKKDGMIMVLNMADYQIIHEGREVNEPITCMAFSGDGKYLAAAHLDNRIVIFNVREGYQACASVTAHSAPVVSLDFAHDSQVVMSCDEANVQIFSECSSGTQIRAPDVIRDIRWMTWTAPVGWSIQGAIINAPYPIVCVRRSGSNALVAAGDIVGGISLFRYPCAEASPYLYYAAHAGKVGKVQWSAADDRLITVCTMSGTIMQWRCVYDNAREDGEEDVDHSRDSLIERDGGYDAPSSAAAALQEAGDSTGRHIGQPWVESLLAPTQIPSDDPSQPFQMFEPVHCFGARTSDSRHCISYNCDGNIISVTAALGVVTNTRTNAQVLFTGHKRSVIAVTVTSDGLLAASADMGNDPEIQIWSTLTAARLVSLQNVHHRGVTSLAFSCNGELLASLGQDFTNCVAVHRSPGRTWTNGDSHLAFNLSTGPGKMLWMLFTGDTFNESTPLCVGGCDGIQFFAKDSPAVNRTVGIFGKKGKIQPLLCACEGLKSESDVTILTGTVSGDVYVWAKGCLQQSIHVHDEPVYGLCRIPDGYATASKDGSVRLWNEHFHQLFHVNVKLTPAGTNWAPVQSLRCNQASTKLAFTIQAGEVFEMSLLTKAMTSVHRSHGGKSARGLAFASRSPHLLATSGADGFVCVWDALKYACVRDACVDYPSSAVCWSLDDAVLVVGCGCMEEVSSKDGAFVVLDALTMDVVYENRHAKLWISDIQYAPNNSMLAIASADGGIYLHDPQSFALLKVARTPSDSSITFVDFSKDSQYLRASTGKYELYNFNVEDVGHVVPSNSVRDTQWAATRVPFGWTVQGAHQSQEHARVLSVDVDPAGKLLVAGFSNGDIRLFNHPCQTSGALFQQLKGPSTFVPRVRFSCDGNTIAALDGGTKSILLYRQPQLHVPS